jgi:deoxyadenosine/deoxycytidine kinase
MIVRDKPLIAVVGVCAAGKSTLVSGLRAHGFNARQVLQEHSYVPYMWQRITDPDLLIYLDCSIETTRARRNDRNFEAWILEEERRRLRHAREHCHLYIPTDDLSPDEILARALEFVSQSRS